MTHRLKTWIEYYQRVCQGDKTFEVRKNDRDFQVGDTLILEEWDQRNEGPTGHATSFEITYLLPGGQFGIEAGFCVMGIKGVGRGKHERR